MFRPIFIAIVCLAACFLAGFQSPAPESHKADPVAILDDGIATGAKKLEFRPGGNGYLLSLLHELGINVDSQLLVFSKSSFQAPLISPHNPRAVYFNDEVSVGFVPGGEVYEITSLDPVRGVLFYTLSTQPSPTPHFEPRGGVCGNCHGPATTTGVGLMVASVYPGVDGTPFFAGNFFALTDHRTPLEARWGGWYVTGTHGSQHPMANAVAHDPNNPGELEQEGTQNLTNLPAQVDAGRYLAPTSDLVALMTLEHQAHMTNLITAISYETRLKRTWLPRWDAEVEELVAYMLFVDEATLTSPVRGVSAFTKSFPERGPRDSQGRSLRDFDLNSRLFRYPLSYMIYSDIFNAMPALARDRVYQRLYDVLTGKEAGSRFARRTADDRRAILEILSETKPELPEYWRQ